MSKSKKDSANADHIAWILKHYTRDAKAKRIPSVALGDVGFEAASAPLDFDARLQQRKQQARTNPTLYANLARYDKDISASEKKNRVYYSSVRVKSGQQTTDREGKQQTISLGDFVALHQNADSEDPYFIAFIDDIWLDKSAPSDDAWRMHVRWLWRYHDLEHVAPSDLALLRTLGELKKSGKKRIESVIDDSDEEDAADSSSGEDDEDEAADSDDDYVKINPAKIREKIMPGGKNQPDMPEDYVIDYDPRRVYFCHNTHMGDDNSMKAIAEKVHVLFLRDESQFELYRDKVREALFCLESYDDTRKASYSIEPQWLQFTSDYLKRYPTLSAPAEEQLPQLRALSMFTGGGGLDAGLTKAGIITTHCVDKFSAAKLTFTQNFPHVPKDQFFEMCIFEWFVLVKLIWRWKQQKAASATAGSAEASNDAPDAEEGDDEYEVEAVIDHTFEHIQDVDAPKFNTQNALDKIAQKSKASKKRKRSAATEDDDSDDSDEEASTPTTTGKSVQQHDYNIKEPQYTLKFHVLWKGWDDDDVKEDEKWIDEENAADGCLDLVIKYIDKKYGIKNFPMPGDIDVVHGGPPCQGFSGNNCYQYFNPFDDPKNQLYLFSLMIIEFYNPKYFILENVVGFLQKIGFAKHVLQTLKQKGFEADLAVLNTQHFNTCQARPRVIVMGVPQGSKLPMFPKHTNVGKDTLFMAIPKEVRECFLMPTDFTGGLVRSLCLADCIGDLPEYHGFDGKKRAAEKAYRVAEPMTLLQRELRAGKTGNLSDHYSKRFINRCELYGNLIPQFGGANWRDMPYYAIGSMTEKYRKRNGGQCLQRPCWDRINNTLNTSPEIYDFCLSVNQNRCYSVREGIRIQGWDDRYEIHKSVTMGDAYELTGNAVPLNFAMALGMSIVEQERMNLKKAGKDGWSLDKVKLPQGMLRSKQEELAAKLSKLAAEKASSTVNRFTSDVRANELVAQYKLTKDDVVRYYKGKKQEAVQRRRKQQKAKWLPSTWRGDVDICRDEPENENDLPPAPSRKGGHNDIRLKFSKKRRGESIEEVESSPAASAASAAPKPAPRPRRQRKSLSATPSTPIETVASTRAKRTSKAAVNYAEDSDNDVEMTDDEAVSPVSPAAATTPSPIEDDDDIFDF